MSTPPKGFILLHTLGLSGKAVRLQVSHIMRYWQYKDGSSVRQAESNHETIDVDVDVIETPEQIDALIAEAESNNPANYLMGIAESVYSLSQIAYTNQGR